MFLEFHGLLEQPFGVTPDPTYLYPTSGHLDALESLSAGIKADRGFLVLMAEPGMGKTTLLYQLLKDLHDSARTVYLFFTQCDSRDFFRYVLDELSIDTLGMDLVAMHAKLNEVLFNEMLAGKRFVLIVNEAQDLDQSVLETIRLLSNFETPHAKLLQIVLAGQPGLAAKLENPELSQLRQRITVVGHLEPLTVQDTAAYVEHWLKVAGYWGEPLFSPEALELVARRSKGIPRNINNLCYNALSLAHVYEQRRVTPEIVQEAFNLTELSHLVQQPQIANPPTTSVATRRGEGLTAPDLLGNVGVPAEQAPEEALEEVPDKVPSLLTYNSRKESKSTRWIFSSVALTGVLLAGGVGWRFFEGRSQKPPVLAAAVQSSSAANSKSEEPAASAGQTADSSMNYAADPQDSDAGQVLTVIAKPQQTLKDISLIYLGHFDRSLYEEICALNPGLSDPDHIQGGQLIRLPLQPHALTKAIDTSDTGNTVQNEPREGLFTRLVALHGK